MPKLWLEFMIISVLIGITLLLLFQNTELNKILFSIGVFSAAAFRILPSINRIINCLQTIRNNLSSINNIVKEISLKKNIVEFPNIKKFNYKSDEINIKNLSYSYPNTMSF